MARAVVAHGGRPEHVDERAFERWQARRRWARAGIIYTVLLMMSIVFLGPLLFATVSSLKTDPLEYPPSLRIPQLSPKNWVAASQLGAAGGGNRFMGGFAPGADVPFEITYFVPAGVEPEAPVAEVPRRRPGAGLGAVQRIDFAADYAEVTPVEEVRREAGTLAIREQDVEGVYVTYGFRILYPGEGPRIDRLPLDITAEPQHTYIDSTLTASRLERRGRVASLDNASPGLIGYVFRNYVRVFREARSVSTGEALFGAWTINSGIYAIARIITNLLFAAMAGYALARLQFPGKHMIFILVLFSQMVPAQVTFISNYLVLRDGIFGLSRIWPQLLLATLLFVAAALLYTRLKGRIDGQRLARGAFSIIYFTAAAALSLFLGFVIASTTGLDRLGTPTLLNSLWGVIIGGAGSSALIEAGRVFIMKQFFESIPREVEEAAFIDGAGYWQRYWSVVLPMARPALGAVAILTFQGAWNDFFWPFIVLTSPEDIKTLPIGLLSFRQTYGAVGDWGLILSGAVMSAIPVIILFIVFQKYFLEGVSYGGGKE
jgi:ABC-type glycerol-3-phosphate transport system permease component